MSNTNHQFQLQLSGLSCGKCVKKVTTALQDKDNDATFSVNDDKSIGTFSTQLTEHDALALVNAVGFSAQALGQPHKHKLDLQNVYCQGCVSKIRKAIQEFDADAVVEVDIEQQQLQASSIITIKQLKQLIDELGYLFKAAPEPTLQSQLKSESVNQSFEFALQGVTCASCVNTIQNALDSTAGIVQTDINFANRSASIQSTLTPELIIKAIESSGYGATQILDQDKAEEDRIAAEKQEYHQKIKHTWLGLGLGVPMMFYGMLGGSMSVTTSTEQFAWLIVGVATMGVLWFAGKHYFTGAWKAFTNRNANMDTLVAMGTGTAWLYSMVVVIAPALFPANASHLYFEASAMIIGLINLGQALELKARGRTSQAIRRLLDLRAKTAVVIRNDQKLTIPVEEVVSGDHIFIRAGEKIPVDGELLEGESTIDESMLTGEPAPILKTTGDTVASGTINGESTITIVATKVGSETVLAQIIQMVSKAQNSKPPISQLADKVSSIFVPTVMIIAVLTALAWYNFGPQPTVVNMLVTATSVLIIACPCALGLATPISTMIGVGKAAESGGLIRNGDALQKASDINLIVLDKTGTITEGNPSVVNSLYLDGQRETLIDEKSIQQILASVKAIEEGSTHPLAKAVITHCGDVESARGLEGFESHTGLGVSAKINNQNIMVGSHKLMANHSIDASFVSDTAIDWETQANTVIYVAVDGVLSALIGISDPIKTESKQAISLLQKQGIRVAMLTGDNARTAEAVAQATGIDEFKAELMPEDKLKWVTQWQKEGYVVGMAGDGINDAPALAQSDVGFAIGHGTDVAIESADITLMRGSLIGISQVIEISKATMTNIKQNLWGAFIYNSLGIPIAAGILFPFTGMLLSPIIAGVAMSLSSITVVSNANRLRLFESKFKESRDAH